MTEDNSKKSALNVQKGIDQPSQLNPSLASGLHKFKKTKPTVDDFYRGILNHERSMLGRAITLIESSLVEDAEIAS